MTTGRDDLQRWLAESRLSDAAFVRTVLAGRTTSTFYRWLAGTAPISQALAAYLSTITCVVVDGDLVTGGTVTITLALPPDRRYKAITKASAEDKALAALPKLPPGSHQPRPDPVPVVERVTCNECDGHGEVETGIGMLMCCACVGTGLVDALVNS